MPFHMSSDDLGHLPDDRLLIRRISAEQHTAIKTQKDLQRFVENEIDLVLDNFHAIVVSRGIISPSFKLQNLVVEMDLFAATPHTHRAVMLIPNCPSETGTLLFSNDDLIRAYIHRLGSPDDDTRSLFLSESALQRRSSESLRSDVFEKRQQLRDLHRALMEHPRGEEEKAAERMEAQTRFARDLQSHGSSTEISWQDTGLLVINSLTHHCRDIRKRFERKAGEELHPFNPFTGEAFTE